MQIRRLNFTTSADYAIAPSNSSPQNILEKIVWHKEHEVILAKSSFAIDAAISYLKFAPRIRNFRETLKLKHQKNQLALIAEVKKASPSKGIIRSDFDPVAIAQAYERGGASCLSVLTDQEFFQGGFNNLHLIRHSVDLPLLCKEFIIDPYQIYIARLHGADAILLITAILSDQDLENFSAIAQNLGMSVLIEVHTHSELERVLELPNVDLVGINNRNLETFTVDITNTKNLLEAIAIKKKSDQKSNILWVSESGLYTNQDLQLVKAYGANAVLVGESLVKQEDVEAATKLLLKNEC
ncbi:Indole-3-glycerol phosphate synthase [Synechococcus sp. PCC 7502]|uniref:indole-3-glycerol phosphate synthase TrpC n=1 Tax=Synechococcus sp. PCC 7502 TaxID=1173263 RepID=UPI00029F9F1A|nr:indole-3-glycerol phosphate synthase TrpC [Synechococcus sp. PCC 7502]AFY74351.1 Indole-3-glycerol phosphate synthase [Synechococcus sp. PCC 7502]